MNPLENGCLVKRRHSVYRGIYWNQICRLDETSELSMEEIHRHVHQFVHGTRNLWRQVQCSIKGGADDQEHLRKIDRVRNRVPSWCASCNQWCPYRGVLNDAETNLNIYVSFLNNFHLSVFSLAFVINFWNCKETLWTPRTRRILASSKNSIEITPGREIQQIFPLNLALRFLFLPLFSTACNYASWLTPGTRFIIHGYWEWNSRFWKNVEQRRNNSFGSVVCSSVSYCFLLLFRLFLLFFLSFFSETRNI